MGSYPFPYTLIDSAGPVLIVVKTEEFGKIKFFRPEETEDFGNYSQIYLP